MLWVICVLCFINKTILAKAKTLLLLANANTFLLLVFTSYTTVINCNLIQKIYKILLTKGIYTFLWIIVICFLINKIINISIAADMMHYKQSFVSKKIFLNGLTELEYQYLLFIVISIYLESSFNVVVTFCCCHTSHCCCHRPAVVCHC